MLTKGTLCRDPLDNGGLLVFFPRIIVDTWYNYWTRRKTNIWNRPTLEERYRKGKYVLEWHDAVGSCDQCFQWSVSQFLKTYDINFELPKPGKFIRRIELDIEKQDHKRYGWNPKKKIVSLVRGIDY